MAEHDAGQGFDFEVLHGRFLLGGEVAHLRLGKLDVLEIALCDLRNRAFDLGRAQLEIRRRPIVELLRELAHGGVASGLDLVKNLLDGFANLGVGGLDGAGVHSAFEKAGHLILHYEESLPGLTRQSILFARTLMRRGWTRGSSPQVTVEDAARDPGSTAP